MQTTQPPNTEKYGMMRKSLNRQRHYFDSAEWSIRNSLSPETKSTNKEEFPIESLQPYDIVMLTQSKKEQTSSPFSKSQKCVHN
ncbi:hypothetical protein ENUP19_0315G0006 [Entamoeba nuttalli]|uniref:Uncharacterized protein n=1 Tax=Entamoeba nuttalli TaxID=412467 RepID=A0ABQ0DVV0_9EUKA